jgi:bla regulator protein blaR1
MRVRRPRSCAWLAAIACALSLVAAAPAARAQAQGNEAGELDPHTFRQRVADYKKARKEVKIDPSLLDKYLGNYQYNAFRVFKVTREDDHLVIALSGDEPVPIFPEGPQKFFYKTVAAQISFEVDPQGNVTGLVLHQGGFERPAPRVDAAQAQKLNDNYNQRIASEAPLPGSEAALRSQIEDYERGQPDYTAMSGQLAAQKRTQASRIERQLELAGPLQSLSFLGVGSHGWDVYEAKFANGVFICRIMLQAPDAKISDLLFEFGP